LWHRLIGRWDGEMFFSVSALENAARSWAGMVVERKR
jgi:hypothetical protein